jgi:hypothetical protein
MTLIEAIMRGPSGLPLATWSPCKRHRYTLRRVLRAVAEPRIVAFLMLNPSTADEDANDPTIARCIAFARAWGFDEIEIVNVYALRSTDPRGLWKVADPVGPDNDAAILAACERAELIVCAWGKNAKPARVAELQRLLAGQAAKLHALKTNGDGSPGHPLYLPGSLLPRPFALETP